jgi:hypothetical protein
MIIIIVPPTSVLKHEMAFTSDFLIVWLEETGQRRGPHQVQNSHYWDFSVGVYKNNLDYTENPRFISPARGN